MQTKIHNIAFEKSVLAALMTFSGSFETVSGSISERTFHAERHKYIFNAIRTLAEQGKPYTGGFIEGYLSNDLETFNSMGGEQYLMDIYANSFSDAQNLEFYVSELNRISDHRQVEVIGQRMLEVASDLTVPDVFNEAEALLAKQDANQEKKKTTFTTDEAVDDLIKIMIEKSQRNYESESCHGVRFGIKSLDDYIGSIEPNHFCVIAGREGSGKSTLAQCLTITNTIRYKKSGLFISAEMDKETLVSRLISAYGSIPFENIHRGTMYDGFMPDFTAASEVIRRLPIIIEEKQMPTISEIRTYIRKAKRKFPDLGFVVVDYLGLVKDPRHKDRLQEVASISRELKSMAKEFGVPMIVLAQLNRENVKTGRKPRASDLKESGQIEQDADQIILVHPELVENSEESLGTSELIIAKNRHGKKGSTRVMNRLEVCRFVGIEQGLGGGV